MYDKSYNFTFETVQNTDYYKSFAQNVNNTNPTLHIAEKYETDSLFDGIMCSSIISDQYNIMFEEDNVRVVELKQIRILNLVTVYTPPKRYLIRRLVDVNKAEIFYTNTFDTTYDLKEILKLFESNEIQFYKTFSKK